MGTCKGNIRSFLVKHRSTKLKYQSTEVLNIEFNSLCTLSVLNAATSKFCFASSHPIFQVWNRNWNNFKTSLHANEALKSADLKSTVKVYMHKN